MVIDPAPYSEMRSRMEAPKSTDRLTLWETLWGALEDYPGAMTVALRTCRALLVWPLVSWLLMREPVSYPHYLTLGFLFALLSCSSMTRWVTSAFIAGLLVLVILPPELADRILKAL